MTGQPPATSPAAVLSVEDLNVRLGGRQILNDVSFTMREGEFTGLIGANGAGKTTLLKVILGLQPPTSGTVRVAGQTRAGGLGWSATCRRRSRSTRTCRCAPVTWSG